MIILKAQVPHTATQNTYTKTSGKRKLSMPVLNNGKPEKKLVLINLQLISINKNDFSFFLKCLREREELDVMTCIIPDFTTLEPYVKNCIICSGFWDSISHPGPDCSELVRNLNSEIKGYKVNSV